MLSIKVGHDGWVQALAFHPSGKYLLSVGDDRSMRIWDLKTGRCLRKSNLLTKRKRKRLLIS